MSTTLTSLAEGADLLVTGLAYQEAAANVAEYYDIPLATLHYSRCGPTASSCHSCRRRWAAPQ